MIAPRAHGPLCAAILVATLGAAGSALPQSQPQPQPQPQSQPQQHQDQQPQAQAQPRSPQPAEPFATAESARIETFGWLAGCWSMALPNGLIEEHWLAPAGGAMLGLSRTIRAGRMSEFEYLALRVVDGTLSYVALPSRQRETVFPLVRHKSTALVFENSAHDYPQRIVYRRTAQGIAARIEGMVKGQLRGSDYEYRPCPSP